MKRIYTFFAAMTVVANSQAALIDFEDAGSFGADDAIVTDAYLQSYGLSMTATAGRNARQAVEQDLIFEANGADGTDSFYIDSSSTDLSALGDYFLKIGSGDIPLWRDRFFDLSIGYNVEVASASGQIWDIDSSEQFSVVGYDENGNAVASVISPRGGLDGVAWNWSLDVTGADTISSVEIDLIGGGRLRGIAFDNFNYTTATVPVPAAFPIGCLGLLGVILRRRKRNRLAG